MQTPAEATRIVETDKQNLYSERLKAALIGRDYIDHNALLNAMAELTVSPEVLAKAKKPEMASKQFVYHPVTDRWIPFSQEEGEKALNEKAGREKEDRAALEKEAEEHEDVKNAKANLVSAIQLEKEATRALNTDRNNVALQLAVKNANQNLENAKIIVQGQIESFINHKMNAERDKKLEEIAATQHRQTLMGNPRSELNWTARDLQERILKVQIYNHIEMLIAFRMAAPVSLPGILMFIISASYGDIDFKNQDVQTTLTIGFVATLGVLGAAWYIKSILHRKWYCDVDQALATYKRDLDAYVTKYLGEEAEALTREIMPLIEANVKYAQHNWYPHIDTDELNWVGFRKTALNGDKEDSPELAHHKDRRRTSSAVTVGVNFVGLICGVILAGMAHEKRSFLHNLLNKKPDLPNQPGETPPPKGDDSSDWFSTVFGQEPAFYAVAGLLVLGVAASVFLGVREYNKATKNPLLTGKEKEGTTQGFGRLRL